MISLGNFENENLSQEKFYFDPLFDLIFLKSWKNAILGYFFGWKNVKKE